MERATTRLFKQNIDALGGQVAADTVARLVGEKRFVDLLSDRRRGDLLGQIILAHLDETATDLSRRTAAQLSRGTSIHNYRVRYSAYDTDTPSHARLHQSLFTAREPSRQFRYQLNVIEPQEKSKADYQANPDVFAWRHWLAPTQSVDEILDSFNIESVKVNDVPLTNIRIEVRTTHAVRFVADYTPVSASEYRIEAALRLPVPYEGSYIYLEPGVLCRGVTIECDTARSRFKATTVDTLGTDNVTMEDTRDRDGRVIRTTVSTDAWVLPNASVAFVFYRPREFYNLAAPQEPHNGDPAAPRPPRSGARRG